MIEADDWDGLARHHGHKCTVTRTPDGIQVICVDCGDKLVQVADVRAVVAGCLPKLTEPAGQFRPDKNDAVLELIDATALVEVFGLRFTSAQIRLEWLARRMDLAEWSTEQGGP